MSSDVGVKDIVLVIYLDSNYRVVQIFNHETHIYIFMKNYYY
jgi:hypothetical protein